MSILGTGWRPLHVGTTVYSGNNLKHIHIFSRKINDPPTFTMSLTYIQPVNLYYVYTVCAQYLQIRILYSNYCMCMTQYFYQFEIDMSNYCKKIVADDGTSVWTLHVYLHAKYYYTLNKIQARCKIQYKQQLLEVQVQVSNIVQVGTCCSKFNTSSVLFQFLIPLVVFGFSSYV